MSIKRLEVFIGKCDCCDVNLGNTGDGQIGAAFISEEDLTNWLKRQHDLGSRKTIDGKNYCCECTDRNCYKHFRNLINKAMGNSCTNGNTSILHNSADKDIKDWLLKIYDILVEIKNKKRSN